MRWRALQGWVHLLPRWAVSRIPACISSLGRVEPEKAPANANNRTSQLSAPLWQWSPRQL